MYTHLVDKLPCVTAKSIEILQKTLKTQKNNPLHQTRLNSPNLEKKKKKHTKRRQRQIHTYAAMYNFCIRVYILHEMVNQRCISQDASLYLSLCVCVLHGKNNNNNKKTLNMNTHVWTCVFPGSDFSNLCKHGDGSLHHAVSHCCALRPLSVSCVMDDREGK